MIIEINCDGSTLCMYKSDSAPRVGEFVRFMQQGGLRYEVTGVEHLVKQSVASSPYHHSLSHVFVQVVEHPDNPHGNG